HRIGIVKHPRINRNWDWANVEGHQADRYQSPVDLALQRGRAPFVKFVVVGKAALQDQVSVLHSRGQAVNVAVLSTLADVFVLERRLQALDLGKDREDVRNQPQIDFELEIPERIVAHAEHTGTSGQRTAGAWHARLQNAETYHAPRSPSSRNVATHNR